MQGPNEVHPEEPKLSVAEDLLKLYDHLSEFDDCCSFLCDTFCCLAAEENALDSETIEGLKCLSYWIKQRVGNVKAEIQAIQERARIELTDAGSECT